MFDRLQDARVRSAAFGWLVSQVNEHGDVLPRSVLAQGFDLDGAPVPLLGPQGIFKSRVLTCPSRSPPRRTAPTTMLSAWAMCSITGIAERIPTIATTPACGR